jgi:hypothetical protein
MAVWLINQLPGKNRRVIHVGNICDCIYSCQNSLRYERTMYVIVMVRHARTVNKQKKSALKTDVDKN